MHQGQICMTSGRHVVHASIYDEYVAALAEKAAHLPVGDPKSGTVAIGPIIDEKQLKRVDGIVQPNETGPTFLTHFAADATVRVALLRVPASGT